MVVWFCVFAVVAVLGGLAIGRRRARLAQPNAGSGSASDEAIMDTYNTALFGGHRAGERETFELVAMQLGIRVDQVQAVIARGWGTRH